MENICSDGSVVPSAEEPPRDKLVPITDATKVSNKH